jgi:type IV pilus assembly protein PilA
LSSALEWFPRAENIWNLKGHFMKKQSGFSLIELLIVVAIILIIAAIAIPNLLRSRISANEAATVGSLRTLNSAEITYQTTYPDLGYSCVFDHLGPGNGNPSSISAGLIDSTLASANKSGYHFSTIRVSSCPVSNGLTIGYEFGARPQTAGQTGQRYFCTDQSGVLQYDASTSILNCITSGNPL